MITVNICLQREPFRRGGSSWRRCHFTNRSPWTQDSAPSTNYVFWWPDRAAGKNLWKDTLSGCLHSRKACSRCWPFWGKNSGTKVIAVNAGKKGYKDCSVSVLIFKELGLSITARDMFLSNCLIDDQWSRS